MQCVTIFNSPLEKMLSDGMRIFCGLIVMVCTARFSSANTRMDLRIFLSGDAIHKLLASSKDKVLDSTEKFVNDNLKTVHKNMSFVFANGMPVSAGYSFTAGGLTGITVFNEYTEQMRQHKDETWSFEKISMSRFPPHIHEVLLSTFSIDKAASTVALKHGILGIKISAAKTGFSVILCPAGVKAEGIFRMVEVMLSTSDSAFLIQFEVNLAAGTIQSTSDSKCVADTKIPSFTHATYCKDFAGNTSLEYAIVCGEMHQYMYKAERGENANHVMHHVAAHIHKMSCDSVLNSLSSGNTLQNAFDKFKQALLQEIENSRSQLFNVVNIRYQVVDQLAYHGGGLHHATRMIISDNQGSQLDVDQLATCSEWISQKNVVTQSDLLFSINSAMLRRLVMALTLRGSQAISEFLGHELQTNDFNCTQSGDPCIALAISAEFDDPTFAGVIRCAFSAGAEFLSDACSSKISEKDQTVVAVLPLMMSCGAEQHELFSSRVAATVVIRDLGFNATHLLTSKSPEISVVFRKIATRNADVFSNRTLLREVLNRVWESIRPNITRSISGILSIGFNVFPIMPNVKPTKAHLKYGPREDELSVHIAVDFPNGADFKHA